MVAEKDGYITVTFSVLEDEETGQYVARCIELGVASCGDSTDDALEQLADAMDLYLNSIEEEGERERVFAECGIRILSGEPGTQGHLVTVHDHETVSARNMRIPVGVA